MKRRTRQWKCGLVWRSAAVFLTTTAVASAALHNGGFEDNGGSLDCWTTFNNVVPNVLAESITPRSGTHVAKVFGGCNGNPNYSGLYQSLVASPDQVWQASAYARHNSGDSLVGGPNSLVMKIEFYRVFGGEYGTSDMLQENEITILSGSSPENSWEFHSFQVTAPAETVEARIAFVFVQHNSAGGAGLIDDVTFTNNSTPIEWDLIWQDEFDGASIDTSKWRVQDAFLVKNNELQYYAPDDVYLQSGMLVLRSQERWYEGHQYTSGLVETIDRFAQAYGRIVIRAKLPFGQGMWPAHWMMVTSGDWPPEIDIMELLGHEPNTVYMSHHWGVWPDVQGNSGSFVGPDFSQDFHTFAIEWFPDRINWLVDDVVRFVSVANIPQEPFYVILNTAVGGDWPGPPDETTVFPQYHEIDYVRVYVPDDSGAALLELADPTSATASANGVIDAGEYIGSTNGINSGFGDLIGQNSVLYVDSGSDDWVNFGFAGSTSWPTSGADGVVIYIDSVEGGFASTYELNQTSNLGRRLASGNGTSGERSELFFALGFRADYAVCLMANMAYIYELGKSGHTTINGAGLGSPTDVFGGNDVAYHGDGSTVREFRAKLSHFGAQPGDSFDFVVTLLNGDTAFRSNEFVGVASGNPWDGNNIGTNDAVLKPSDFVRFQAAPMWGDFDGDGDVELDDYAVFQDCLSGPEGSPSPTPPIEEEDCLNAFDADWDTDIDLADFAVFQTAAGEYAGP